MLDWLISSLIRLVRTAFSGILWWFVSLFLFLIIGTILELPAQGGTTSTLYSLAVVFIPIIIGFVSFCVSGKKKAPPSQDIPVYSLDELEAFLDAHDVVDEFRTKVAGVTFCNNDGSSRQSILSLCSVGDQVYFHYFDYRGSPAYSVTTDYGQIGNLPADLAETIDKEYDGCTLYGTITKISGGEDGFFYGCNLLIYVFREKEIATTHEPTARVESISQTPQSAPIRNTTYSYSRKQKKPKEISVDSSFIAEAQWYAARGGTDLVDDE